MEQGQEMTYSNRYKIQAKQATNKRRFIVIINKNMLFYYLKLS